MFSPLMVSVALFSRMHRVTQSVPATFKSEAEQGHGSGERGRKKKTSCPIRDMGSCQKEKWQVCFSLRPSKQQQQGH